MHIGIGIGMWSEHAGDEKPIAFGSLATLPKQNGIIKDLDGNPSSHEHSL